jgi:G3E family GTPase
MAVRVTVISGFLGSGKTTFIKKLLESDVFLNKPILLENDYGEVNIDAFLLEKTGITINTVNAGCICCSASGNFIDAILSIVKEYPDSDLIIEPSGIGKLSDILELLHSSQIPEKSIKFQGSITLVDVTKFRTYESLVPDYLWDQINHAQIILLNKHENIDYEELIYICDKIYEINPDRKLKIHTMNENPSIIYRYLENCDFTDHMHSHCYHEHGSHKDDIFEYWNGEIPHELSSSEIVEIFDRLDNYPEYGTIYRVKGVASSNQTSFLFDYVPSYGNIIEISPVESGKVTVIGIQLNKIELSNLFNTSNAL